MDSKGLKMIQQLLCKKDLMHQQIMIEKGKFYTSLEEISQRCVYVQLDMNVDCVFSTTLYSSVSPLYLWDFFYTPKEMRKLKLDKLNEEK